MHGSVLGYFLAGALTEGEVAGRRVLEVGSHNVNGSVRPLVERYEPYEYIGVDLVGGEGVDQICSAMDLLERFGPDSFDVVISTEMLEHCLDWQGAVSNMVRVLRVGGVLCITTRSEGFGRHWEPDYWRFSKETFQALAEFYGLEVTLLADDPEYPGVFFKANKPVDWQPPSPAALGGTQGVTPV